MKRRMVVHAMATSMCLLAAAAVPAEAQQPSDPPRVIRVSGTATVKASPDRARLTVAVVSRAPTAKAASEANATASQSLLAKLESLVKAPGEVRTAGYDLSAEYDYQERPGAAQRRLLGYVASNRLLVVTDDLPQVGALIDSAVEAGANEIESISFYLDDEDAARRQALLEAGRRARAEAEIVAESLGVALGPLVDASSESRGGPIPIYGRNRMAMMESAGADAATAVLPGTLEISATVSVTFGIR
ncbi:MAG TPA: SIMPL domain-containing protein [Candidatus Limnocylindrales bacterium]|nr:SIMPL domain-containing protein [Candidatus Limnocylindrales bacterium]